MAIQVWHSVFQLQSLYAIGATLPGVALVLRQWRLRRKEHEDFKVQMAVLAANPKADVLGNRVKLRQAENEPRLEPAG